MDRRHFLGWLGAGTAVGLLPAAAAAAGPAPKARNIVLAHGLFADGSCWSKVIARLQAEDLHVTAVQNPLTSLGDAVAATQRVLAMQDGATVLVGHSFAGMIVTEAGIDPKVTALVYVAARAPDAGEDYAALASRFPKPPAAADVVYTDDWGQLGEEAFLKDFANGVPEKEARVLFAVQEPFKKSLNSEKVDHAAWHTKPSYYVVSKEDRTIDPDFQRFMAKRMGATTTEVDAGHLSLISHPDPIAEVILKAAGQR